MNLAFITLSVRKERDSNPRYAERTTVFETAPIDHSGIFPSHVFRFSLRFTLQNYCLFLNCTNFWQEK